MRPEAPSYPRTAASQDAIAVGLDRLTTARDLLSDAEAAYARYWHADQAVAVLDRRIALLRQVEEMAGVRYALGRAAQQDAIRAQVEQTSLQRERIERLAAKQEAAATLNAVLGRRSDSPLATPDEPPRLVVQSASLAEALDGADAHPAVRSQQARAEAARTNVVLERRNRFPDITVGVGAMQFGNGIESTELMLEVEIPFQQRARRERERGYNQAKIIGQLLAGKLGCSFAPNALQRVRATRQQAALSRSERAENVRGAFISRCLPAENIILVDDVFTTGATMNACASALKAAGARRVWGFALAKG